jgi:hypothetical protein
MATTEKLTFTGSIEVLTNAGIPTAALGYDSVPGDRMCYCWDSAHSVMYVRLAGAWHVMTTTNPQLLIYDQWGDRLIVEHCMSGSGTPSGYVALSSSDPTGKVRAAHQGGADAINVPSAARTANYNCVFKDTRQWMVLEVIMTVGQHIVTIEGQQ